MKIIKTHINLETTNVLPTFNIHTSISPVKMCFQTGIVLNNKSYFIKIEYHTNKHQLNKFAYNLNEIWIMIFQSLYEIFFL